MQVLMHLEHTCDQTTRVNNVDDNYVDGISLTHGRNPREHTWTFVAALDEVGTIYRYPLWKVTVPALTYTILHLHLNHLALLGITTSVIQAVQINGHTSSTLMIHYGMELVVYQPTPVAL